MRPHSSNSPIPSLPVIIYKVIQQRERKIPPSSPVTLALHSVTAVLETYVTFPEIKKKHFWGPDRKSYWKLLAFTVHLYRTAFSSQSHLFYKAVCAIYAHTYTHTHTHIYVSIYICILFQAVVTGRTATDAEINVYVTLQRIERSSCENREFLLSPKQGLLLNTLTWLFKYQHCKLW